MLNERERRELARIEQELQRSDPDLARMFARRRPRRISGAAVLLTLGMIVMMVGSAMVSVTIAVLGIGIAIVALITAYHRSRPLLGPSGAT